MSRKELMRSGKTEVSIDLLLTMMGFLGNNQVTRYQFIALFSG